MGGRSLLVAGDIGGTNARLSLFDASEALAPAQQPCVYRASYKNDKYATFNDLVLTFLREAGVNAASGDALEALCLAVAGPVSDNRVNFTNRQQWLLDANELRLSFNVQRVCFVNDFVANGYGLLTLDEQEECFTLAEGKRDVRRPIARLGAGTGLGECFLTPSDPVLAERLHASGCCESGLSSDLPYDAYPTEGGHVEFAPRDELEAEMLRFLQDKFSESGHRVSVERIVSGRGLVSVYEFLRQKYPERVNPRYDRSILEAEEGGALVAKYAYECAFCAQAMNIMMSVYGSEVGNVALKYLPFGGLYVTGGIAPKNLDCIKGSGSDFMRSLYDKGRVSQMLYKVPVKVVLAEDLGLRGAHLVATRMHSAALQTATAKETENAANTPLRGLRFPTWLKAAATGAGAGEDGKSGSGDARQQQQQQQSFPPPPPPPPPSPPRPFISIFKPLDLAVYVAGMTAIVGSVAFSLRALVRSGIGNSGT